MWVKVRYINRVRSKGRVYYYHRHTGERLPDEVEARARRAIEINSGLSQSGSSPTAGSLEAAIRSYKSAPEYTDRAPRTRRDYDRHLHLLGTKFGDLALTDIDRGFVLELRDALSATPRTANYTIQVLRIVLSFAVDRGWLEVNVARRPRLLKTGEGYRAWPDAALERFRRDAPAELKWAFEVGLYTGQRGGDCLRLQWHHYNDGVLLVTQRKRGKRLEIPAHPDLARVLSEIPRRAVTILTTPAGRPWREDHFRHRFHRAILDCDLNGLTFHGLRHTAGRKLAEAGCTENEIMAILGLRTSAMAVRYTRQADQKRLAKAGIHRLERNRK